MAVTHKTRDDDLRGLVAIYGQTVPVQKGANIAWLPDFVYFLQTTKFDFIKHLLNYSVL